MMTFFKEAFQVNRKSYPERVRSALFHAIKKTAANLDACVKVPGKDFSRKRKLPLQTILLMLIGMGGGSFLFLEKLLPRLSNNAIKSAPKLSK